MKFYYGMRLRGFAPLCQPMLNLLEVQDDANKKFWNILVYSEPLTKEQVKNFELEFLKIE